MPRLPIIEPERVASPPLAIALTDVYRYRLDGRETIGATPCYVVAFEPDPSRADRSATLFRGRAWIAAGLFRDGESGGGADGASRADRRVRAGRRLPGRLQPGVWLLARSDVRQMYEGAAHRTPIHRVLAIDRDEVNPPDFAARRRQRAYGSAAVMLRDTPEGYRYLKKDADARNRRSPIDCRPRRSRPDDRGRRHRRSEHLRAAAVCRPQLRRLQSVLDTGTQFNGFFGGTYGQLAFSVPSLARHALAARRPRRSGSRRPTTIARS